MKISLSKIIFAAILVIILTGLYYINSKTNTLEKITTFKQSVQVLMPQPKEELTIGDTYTIKWSGLKNIPDAAVIYARLSGGPTPGVVIDEPYPVNSEFIWDVLSSRGDDIVTRLEPGRYSLHFKIYKRSFCDQALCWNRMPNSAQVPVIAESKDIEITLVDKE